jgi:sjoegren syndrome nuclear autoantigen 1
VPFKISRPHAARNEFDQTIQETEAAYMKVGTCQVFCDATRRAVQLLWLAMLLQILESSQTLLNVLKRETVNLSKKRTVP